MKTSVRRCKIGYKIKLNDYTVFSDYRSHKGQVATIFSYIDSSSMDYRVVWDDGTVSSVYDSNAIPQDREWDVEDN